MYLYHGTTWAFIVVQNTKRFFAGDCTKHQMYLYHSSRTGACSVEQAHTHIACTAVTGNQVCPQPSFRAMQPCCCNNVCFKVTISLFCRGFAVANMKTTNYKFVNVLDRDKLVSVLTHQTCCYITVEHVVP